MLATDLACALDPTQLATAAGIPPDPWQVAALRSPAPRQLWNASRQSGKSTTVAVLSVHTALYEPGALVLLLSPSLRQSGELFRKVMGVYEAAGRRVPAEAESALRLELANGSRIVALPGKEATIRSFSGVRLLIFDEASRVADSLYHACRPMLAVSGGRLVALSTPWGKRGWWYQAWTEGGPSWERVEITAAACPRIPASFLAEEAATLPPAVYRAEYECRFEDNAQALFATTLIAGMWSADVEPLFPDLVAADGGALPGLDAAVDPLFEVVP